MSAQEELPLALRAAYLTLHRLSDSRFAEFGVTADQFVLLATLARGQALTQRELAARMTSDPSTVRAMLVLLEKSQLVKRDTHPTDARARTVCLTAAGRRVFQKLWKAGDSLRARMIQSLQPGEAELLVDILRRISSSLNSERLPGDPSTIHTAVEVRT